jgi:hypothetical protein
VKHTDHDTKFPSSEADRLAALAAALARTLGFGGSSARSVGVIAVVAFALSAFVPGVALAAVTRLPEPFSPITGSGSGITIGVPGGVAADEASGNLFLNDGTTLTDILGDEGAAPAELVSPFQITGLALTAGTNGVAVDNSAASPNQGTVYIVSGNKVKKFTRNTLTEKYEPAGELTPVAPEGSHFGTAGRGGVAVDAQGDLYVGEWTCQCVVKFDPSGTEVGKYNFSGPSPVVRPTYLAVGGDGSLFIGRAVAGSVFKFASPGSGEFVRPEVTEIIGSGATGLAIDPAREKLYIALGTRVAQYDAATLSEEGSFGEGTLSATAGLAVNSATDRVYVADGTGHSIEVFGPAVPVPGTNVEAATSVNPVAGTLNGTIEPAGVAVTGCVFEYGTSSTALATSTPCVGSIPTDNGSHHVTGAATALDPGTTYFYRLTATNANGTSHSGIESFTTPQPALTEAASDVTPRRATLHGTVLPEGEDVTGCYFEYGLDATYGASVPCEGSTPTDEGSHPVTGKIAGLKPAGVIYHFRLVIERGPIVAHGIDMTLETAGTVTTGTVALTGTDEAVVGGTVDPAGEQLQQCEFEYGETESYGETAPCSQSPASIGDGEDPVAVSAEVDGLTLEREYHYRLSVIDGEGTTIHGGDRSFLTSPPKISSEQTISVGLDNATIEARFKTFGNEIEAYFEYGTTTSYGQVTAAVKLGGEPEQFASEPISGLANGTTYHWRVVVLNPLGDESGPDRTFTTQTPRPLETNCPNQQFRSGTPSASLPDCRAYEKVTPNDKNGVDGVRNGTPAVGTPEGDGLSFMSYATFAGSKSSSFPNAYLAHRGPDGWHVSPASAPTPIRTTAAANSASYEFSSDLSRRLATVIAQPLAEGATPEVTNLFAVDQAGAYSWVNDMPPAVKLPEECPVPSRESACFQLVDLMAFAGASEDFQHVLFEYKGSLPDPETLYRSDFENGSWHVSPVDTLPDGQPAPGGSTAGSGSRTNYSSNGVAVDNRVINAMSADGANVIFQAVSDEGEPNEAGQAGMTQVYDSVGRGPTIKLSAPAPGATPAHPGAGPATFWAASTDGSRVFFTSRAELTTPSNTGPGHEGNDLYEYSFAGGGTLTDLTVDSSGAGARVLGVLNASDDGSTIYFVARGELSPGEGQAGEPNLYVIRNGGAPIFIATLNNEDFGNWEAYGLLNGLPVQEGRPGGTVLQSYVTPDGDNIAFTSRQQLPTSNFPGGYDNLNPRTGTAEPEVYEYSAVTRELVCVSCNPSGAAPVGASMLAGIERPGANQEAGRTQNSASHLVRPVSADGGRVFFNSGDPLVPGIPVSNTVGKVFEFERAGVGGCTNPTGCVNLISSPTPVREAVFLEADESGQNVFFSSGDRLTGSDQDNSLDVYDARVGGGFPEPTVQPPCEAEGCRGPGSSATPVTTNSPTSSFKGPGNGKKKAPPKKCRKGQVKKHKRCVKRKHHKKHHGKHHKSKKSGKAHHKSQKKKGGHQDRRSGADRRAGR